MSCTAIFRELISLSRELSQDSYRMIIACSKCISAVVRWLSESFQCPLTEGNRSLLKEFSSRVHL